MRASEKASGKGFDSGSDWESGSVLGSYSAFVRASARGSAKESD